MAIAKTATPQTDWRDDRVHSGTKIITFGVRTEERRDLVVELTARVHPKFDRTIIDYGLFKIDPIFRQQDRLYQLTIDDPQFKSHMEYGKPPIYGSHEHIGDITLAMSQCNGTKFEDGLALFLDRVNLVFDDGPIENPFELILR